MPTCVPEPSNCHLRTRRPVHLPVPNEQEVKSFQAFWKERFGVELEPQDALLVATKLAQTFYIQNFGACPHYQPPPQPLSTRQPAQKRQADTPVEE